MKKFVFILSLISLGLLSFILVFSYNKKIVEEEKYYTIPQIKSYIYEEDKQMEFTIYANTKRSLIEYQEQNSYTLHSKGNQYKINDIKITKEQDSEMGQETYYKYILEMPLLSILEEDIVLEQVHILIQNEEFRLDCLLGDLAIYKKNYTPLEFHDLYGNYSYIEGELHFIGLTIELDKSYQMLEEVKIIHCFSPISYIEKDILYDSQRTINEFPYPFINDTHVSDTFPLTAKENYYYIPISYPYLHLITNVAILMKIDGSYFYISDFTYLANKISLKDYPKLRVEGEYQNA